MENIKYPQFPIAQQDRRDLVQKISLSFTANPQITLQWTDESIFKTKANDYEAAVNTRVSIGADRPEETQTLENLDKQIDNRLSDLKGYCIGKWNPNNAPSHYAQFGIVHRHDSYIWPTDRNERKNALQMAKDACTAAGFTGVNYPFGDTFLDALLTAYVPALAAGSDTDGQVASYIGTRDVLWEYLSDAMDALLLAIRANYPQTYRNTWRLWGWQNEDL